MLYQNKNFKNNMIFFI